MSDTLPPLADVGGPWELTPNRKRFTRQECECLEHKGLLIQQYELIEGDILFKMGQNAPHRLTIMLIVQWLNRIFGDDRVCSQGPIEVGLADPEINAPQPDICVQALPAIAFAIHLPGPADILLLVEVSDSTLRFDLRNKAALYARAGIVEYWVADVSGRRFIVHREPTPNGYAQITEYAGDAVISTLSRPDVTVRVSDLLPPVQAA